MGDHPLPWLSLLLLGAAHGVNPAMGWLFAVARGLQERSQRALWRALGPLAVGHALSIVVVLLLATTLGQLVPLQWLKWLVAAALVTLGADGLRRHRHVSLGGMRVNARELATWSFLVASVHGAGLMVLPLLLAAAAPSPTAALRHHHEAMLLAVGPSAGEASGIAAALIHTTGYLTVTAMLALVVYEKVGLRILRRAWINVNVLWAAALIAAGAMTMLQ